MEFLIKATFNSACLLCFICFNLKVVSAMEFFQVLLFEQKHFFLYLKSFATTFILYITKLKTQPWHKNENKNDLIKIQQIGHVSFY